MSVIQLSNRYIVLSHTCFATDHYRAEVAVYHPSLGVPRFAGCLSASEALAPAVDWIGDLISNVLCQLRACDTSVTYLNDITLHQSKT